MANHAINAKTGRKLSSAIRAKLKPRGIADMHIASKICLKHRAVEREGPCHYWRNLYDGAFVASRTEGFKRIKIVEARRSLLKISPHSASRFVRLRDGVQAESAAIPGAWGNSSSIRRETVRSFRARAMLTGNLGKPRVNPSVVRTTCRCSVIWARCRIRIPPSVRERSG